MKKDTLSVNLAPNGKPSNLNPEQYKLVRTKAFKDWFGDWENDPENASKIVDENGEPLVCYHQSNSEKIDVFKPKSNNNKVYDFFFFSTREQEFLPRKYTYKVFLSAKNIFLTHSTNTIIVDEYGENIGLKGIKTISNKELNELRRIIDENQNIIIEEWRNKNTDSIEDVVDRLKSLNKPHDNVSAIIDFITNWNDSWSVLEQDVIIDYIVKKGYDSFITKEEGITNIALNNPTQIKLADGTNTTFDGNNPDIRFMAGGITQPRDLSQIENYRNIYKGAEFYTFSDNPEKVEKADRWFELFITNQKERQLTPQEFSEFMQLSSELSWEEFSNGGSTDTLFNGGGNVNENQISEKQKTKQYIDDLNLSLEFLSESSQVSTKKLIADLTKAMELMDDESSEKSNEYTYLMTLDEYNQSGIIDLLKEYRKFIKKNTEYLANAGWSDGFDFLTYNEAIELGTNSPFYIEPTINNYRSKNITKNITESFDNKITDYGKIKIDYKNTPISIVEKNKEYREKIMKHFPIDEYKRLFINVDMLKSNKRSIKEAMENKTYFKLLKDGKLDINRLEDITESVGVRITKETYSADKGAELKEFLKSIKVPQQTFESLLQFGKQIKSDLEQIRQIGYDREYARYKQNILESVGKTIRQDELSLLIPFWYVVVDVDTKVIEIPKIYNGRQYNEEIYEYTIKSLKSDWEKQLSNKIDYIVEELMFKIVTTIIKTISFVKIPFASVKTKKVHIGAKGFEGVYEINFTDGSKFDLVTEGIEAGGYNIQAFHYRYISKIENMILPNGESTKSDSHFREYKEVKEKRFDGGGETKNQEFKFDRKNVANEIYSSNKKKYGRFSTLRLAEINTDEILIVIISEDENGKENLAYEKVHKRPANSMFYDNLIKRVKQKPDVEEKLRNAQSYRIYPIYFNDKYTDEKVKKYFELKNLSELYNDYVNEQKIQKELNYKEKEKEYPIDEKLKKGDYYMIYFSTRGDKTKSKSYLKMRFDNLIISETSYLLSKNPIYYLFSTNATSHKIPFNELTEDFKNQNIMTIDDFEEKFGASNSQNKIENYIDVIEKERKNYDNNKDKFTRNRFSKNIQDLLSFVFQESEYSDFEFTDSQKANVLIYCTKLYKNYFPAESLIGYIISSAKDFQYEYNSEISYWDVLKENNLIKPYFVNSVKYKINPQNRELKKIFDDITSKDSLRPIMMGVNFVGNQAIGTDAHKLVHVIGTKEGDFEDGVYPLSKKAIDDNGNGVISGIYPNWKAILPNDCTIRKSLSLPFIYSILENLKKNLVLSKTTSYVQFILKDENNEEFKITFNHELLQDLLNSLLLAGLNHVDACFYSSSRYMLLIPRQEKIGSNEDLYKMNFGLIMPFKDAETQEPVKIELVNEDELNLTIGKTATKKLYKSDVFDYLKKQEKKPEENTKLYYEEIIDSYNNLLEIETDKDKKEYFKEIIDSYKNLLELI